MQRNFYFQIGRENFVFQAFKSLRRNGIDKINRRGSGNRNCARVVRANGCSRHCSFRQAVRQRVEGRRANFGLRARHERNEPTFRIQHDNETDNSALRHGNIFCVIGGGHGVIFVPDDIKAANRRGHDNFTAGRHYRSSAKRHHERRRQSDSRAHDGKLHRNFSLGRHHGLGVPSFKRQTSRAFERLGGGSH